MLLFKDLLLTWSCSNQKSKSVKQPDSLRTIMTKSMFP